MLSEAEGIVLGSWVEGVLLRLAVVVEVVVKVTVGVNGVVVVMIVWLAEVVGERSRSTAVGIFGRGGVGKGFRSAGGAVICLFGEEACLDPRELLAELEDSVEIIEEEAKRLGWLVGLSEGL